MWIGGTEVQEEGAVIARVGDERARLLGHFDGVATVALQIGFVVIDRFGCDVILSDVTGAVAGAGHHAWQRETDHVVKRRKLVIVMLVSKLSVTMIVQSTHHDTATGAA